MEEENFEKSFTEIKKIYADINLMIKENKRLYIIPTELYNEIMKKLGHMEDRIKKQTASLKQHLKDKQELRRKLKSSKDTKAKDISTNGI